MPLIKKLGVERENPTPQPTALEAEIRQIEEVMRELELLWKKAMERHTVIRELSVVLQERRREISYLSSRGFWRRFWKR